MFIWFTWIECASPTIMTKPIIFLLSKWPDHVCWTLIIILFFRLGFLSFYVSYTSFFIQNNCKRQLPQIQKQKRIRRIRTDTPPREEETRGTFSFAQMNKAVTADQIPTAQQFKTNQPQVICYYPTFTHLYIHTYTYIHILLKRK